MAIKTFLMDSTDIYEEYSNALNTLNQLQLRYRFSAGDDAARAVLQQRIRETQERLTQIIRDMIHLFPYLDTKRAGQGMLNE